MAQRKRGKNVKDKKFVTKHISIEENQEEWLDENCINLSKFVQTKIDEVMSKG